MIARMLCRLLGHRDAELYAIERLTLGIPPSRRERVWFAIEPGRIWHRSKWSAPGKRLTFYCLKALRFSTVAVRKVLR